MNPIETGATPLRRVFASTLLELMEHSQDVMYLEADLAGAIGTAELFEKRPQQALNVGIMEANMAGVAAGLSLKGKIPFIHSFGTFASRRCADQVFLSGCYNRANVKIIGSDPGVAAETNGGTHMPLEDVAIFRAFPEMTVFDIAEPRLLDFALRESARRYGMAYLRFPRKWNKAYYEKDRRFEIGKGNILTIGDDVTIVAAGLAVFDALEAAGALAVHGVTAEIIDMFTIKPLDADLLLKSAAKTRKVITIENHSIIGGLGSAVMEVLGERLPVPVRRIGVRDVFGEVGSQAYLKEAFGMTVRHIVNVALELGAI